MKEFTTVLPCFMRNAMNAHKHLSHAELDARRFGIFLALFMMPLLELLFFFNFTSKIKLSYFHDLNSVDSLYIVLLYSIRQ